MHSGAMDWKERQKFESGLRHGIVMAMLSAEIVELVVDQKHSLWSYTHRLSIVRGEDGLATYRIEKRV